MNIVILNFIDFINGSNVSEIKFQGDLNIVHNMNMTDKLVFHFTKYLQRI